MMQKTFRLTRGIKYTTLIIAGLVSLFSPSLVLLTGIGLPYSMLWSIMLIIGSAFSLRGIIKKNWVGEYIGLPAIISCLLLYSAVCFFDFDNFTWVRLFLGMIFLGFAFSTMARRSDVKFQKRIADYENRKKDGKPGL